MWTIEMQLSNGEWKRSSERYDTETQAQARAFTMAMIYNGWHFRAVKINS